MDRISCLILNYWMDNNIDFESHGAQAFANPSKKTYRASDYLSLINESQKSPGSVCSPLSRLNLDSPPSNGEFNVPFNDASTPTTREKRGEGPDGRAGPRRKRTKIDKPYVPGRRTGGYALLIGLYHAEREEPGQMVEKRRLIALSQPYCDESLISYKRDSFYNAFSSMKTLLNHSLVVTKRKNSVYYGLTDAGREMARKIVEHLEVPQQSTSVENSTAPSVPLVTSSASEPIEDLCTHRAVLNIHETRYDSNNSHGDVIQLCDDELPRQLPGDELQLEEENNWVLEEQNEEGEDEEEEEEQVPSCLIPQPFVLSPGQFSVVLLIDTREKTGLLQGLENYVNAVGVKTEVRSLPVGDFLWIAQENDSLALTSLNMGQKRRELILDWIVERKEGNDLDASISDRRFTEQKHRLSGCGVKNRIILVEGLDENGDYKVPYSRMVEALTASQIVDGFNIKYTQRPSDTVEYLASLSELLAKFYSNLSLYSTCLEDANTCTNYFITYDEFEGSFKKKSTFTVKEMFIQHLILFCGLTTKMAKAIVKKFPTYRALISVFDECISEKEREGLISRLTYEADDSRTIGPKLGHNVSTFYSFIEF